MFLIFLCLFKVTTGYISVKEMSFFIQRLIRLCYMVIIFFISCHETEPDSRYEMFTILTMDVCARLRPLKVRTSV